jgi:PAS domain S-box-containing protein
MYAIVVHLNGRFLFLNPAALRLFAAKNTEEIENRALQDFVLRGAQQETEKVVGRTPKGQNILLSKHEVMRLDGVRVPVEAVTGPIRDDGKNATIVIFRDITQQTKLNQPTTGLRCPA